MITVADAQAELDAWWSDVKDPRLARVAAFVAKRWNGPDAGIVRISLVDGADGQGTAVRIELERQDRTLIMRELRPTVANARGLTLDDVEYLGTTRAALAATAAVAAAEAP